MLRFLGIATATAVASRTWLTQVGLALLSMHNHVYVHVALGGQAWATKRVVCVRFIRCPNAMPSPYLAGKPLLYTEGCSMRRKKIPSENVHILILIIEHHAIQIWSILIATRSQCFPVGFARRVDTTSLNMNMEHSEGVTMDDNAYITMYCVAFDVKSCGNSSSSSSVPVPAPHVCAPVNVQTAVHRNTLCCDPQSQLVTIAARMFAHSSCEPLCLPAAKLKDRSPDENARNEASAQTIFNLSRRTVLRGRLAMAVPHGSGVKPLQPPTAGLRLAMASASRIPHRQITGFSGSMIPAVKVRGPLNHLSNNSVFSLCY